MKVLALGGCGEMGRYAVRALIEHGFCSHVVVADINGDHAREFSSQFGSRAGWMKVDVSDPVRLSEALSTADIVMNTVGPFYRFGVQVLRAAIDARRHYMDICDDWEPTLEMLALHERAREAGVTAVIGMGASPGISNLLAAKAVSHLDKVEEIHTGWDLEAALPEKIGRLPSAATVHGIHQMTGFIRVFENGRFVDVRPVRQIKLDYPGIPGTAKVWTIGHPEAVTLPRYYPTLKKSVNVMTAYRSSIAFIRIISWLVEKGIISLERAAWLAEHLKGASDPDMTPDRMVQQRLKTLVRGRHVMPPLFALASGEKGGARAQCGCMILSAPAGGMGGVTGIPLAVGISLVAQGKIRGHGVFAPEGAVVPDDFFDALAPLCSPARQTGQQILLLTRSWDRAEMDWTSVMQHGSA